MPDTPDTTTAAILALAHELRTWHPNLQEHSAALKALVRERDALAPAAELAAALDAAELDGVTPRDGTVLNAWAYRKLLDEDLAWLMTTPRTLERDHVALLLDIENKELRHHNRVWAADRDMVRRQARFVAEMEMGALRYDIATLRAEVERLKGERLEWASLSAKEAERRDALGLEIATLTARAEAAERVGERKGYEDTVGALRTVLEVKTEPRMVRAILEDVAAVLERRLGRGEGARS